MHPRILGFAAVLLAALGAGCGGEDTATCTGDGYRVDYPADWHQERCAWFDRAQFEVPEATEFLDVAVLVSREPIAPGALLEDDRTREVLEGGETTVGGREAVRVEAEATGEGLLDRGVRLYQVAIAADGDSVVLTTYDLDGLDYEGNKQVLDELAESVEPTR